MLLLTNDDGIHADGLRALETAAHRWQSDVITVAPLEPHSGCGHRVTARSAADASTGGRKPILRQWNACRLCANGFNYA